ncbi:MAG: glycosyl hydrolase family 18 protein [Thermomicrobiales bacterium]|nr:glycosyl hydrolase family 18 protein [Thermomicrobiales bacterium]
MKRHQRNRERAIAGIACLVLVALGVSLLPLWRDSDVARARDIDKWAYYVGNDPTSRASLEQNIEQIDVVSPYFYHLTPNGSIKTFAQPDVTAFVKAHGKKVVPLIQNEARWDDFSKQIDTPEERDAIVAKLVEVVATNGYDGIHIDFEGLNQTDREALTDFMRRLNLSFKPRGWIVSQAVIARTSDAPSTWGGVYDYKALAAVNDYVAIMAYDWGYAGRPDPAPVAPIWWVRDVLTYARKQMPDNRILLGIPYYGYDWNTTKGPPATSVTFAKAATLAAQDGAESGYDEDEGSPWIRYTDAAGDQHTVWYENAASFEEKISLVLDRNIAGYATWRLGHEDPSSWYVVNSLATPAARVPAFNSTADRLYFSETGHSLAYGFLTYWQQNGGLARFGYPKTEEFTEYDPLVGKSYTVQYFERARFEYHPEFAGSEFEVLLGHMGRWALAKRGIDPWASATSPKTGLTYFAETGHNMGAEFQQYWTMHGGLMSFGFPISEPVRERNQEDGRTYLVQYFERARFEYHPEYAGTDSEVLLGLLGNEMLRERGWVR